MLNIRDLANASGYSRATVSRALSNSPAVKEETRIKILLKAKSLGYEANPYVGQLMSALRRRSGGAFKGNLAIVWLDGRPAKESDVRLLQMQRGMVKWAEEHGYILSEFDYSAQSPAALRKILWSRGIRGIVVVAASHSAGKSYFNFNLKDFACVSFGCGLALPRLHNVRLDYNNAIREALHFARHKFRAGIAAIWNFKTDRRAQHAVRTAFLLHHPGGSALAQKLFLDFDRLDAERIRSLFQRYKVHCVIAEASLKLPSWLRGLVPDKNMIWLREPDSADAFGWIDTRNELGGEWVLDLLSDKLLKHEYGVPEIPQTLLVPPRWVSGNERRD
jgi:hypothetical protein